MPIFNECFFFILKLRILSLVITICERYNIFVMFPCGCIHIFRGLKEYLESGCLFFLNNRRLMFEKHLFKAYSKVFSIFLATFNVLIDDFSFSNNFLRERKKQFVALLSFAVQLITSFRYYLCQSHQCQWQFAYLPGNDFTNT